MKLISVFILADNALTLEGLRTVVQFGSNCNVVGIARNIDDAMAWMGQVEADAALIDLPLPIWAAHAAAQILSVAPSTHVLVLSSYAADPRIADVIASELRRVGASGLLPKDISAGELADAIRRVILGDAVFPAKPAIGANFGPRPSGPPGIAVPVLTLRQTQVLKLVAEGLANKEIADRLSISPKTVEKHRQSVKEKLHMNNAADLARRAISLGLVQAA